MSVPITPTLAFYIHMIVRTLTFSFFFFNDTATTEIYTLSLHDPLPISLHGRRQDVGNEFPDDRGQARRAAADLGPARTRQDRKSTRLNSSHLVISYAVFCLKKKTQTSRYASHSLALRAARLITVATRES